MRVIPLKGILFDVVQFETIKTSLIFAIRWETKLWSCAKYLGEFCVSSFVRAKHPISRYVLPQIGS